MTGWVLCLEDNLRRVLGIAYEAATCWKQLLPFHQLISLGIGIEIDFKRKVSWK